MIDINVDYILKYAPMVAITIAIVVPILNNYLSNWWRLKKSLSYEIKTNTEIFAIEETIQKKFEVLYEKKLVASPRLFIIAISNDGRQSIEPKDFEKKIEFIFPDNTDILFTETSFNPQELSVDLNTAANSMFIEPLLINKGDYFEVKGIINSKGDEIKCKARISGITKVKRIGLPAPKYSFSMILISIVGLTSSLWFLLSETDEYKSIGFGLIFVVLSYVLHRIYRKQ